ncbi:hypothetical protein CHLNCDRAFT_55206 [Chlorella variabilis]|uniref:APS kinase domain-containing protein n=1 Tax=Chlorella variabilis TaxID=554065 RepID=E1ZS28_CHLVA|nr:hypothetical protein CHLNCDRAFT_55206 [Chlorella variabilis]EFN51374.1 hypothetical protein CHLNCDRAFT_55206 [Chlorella variabilis]|eukprot:XP_005843476.1 hypothetical protein CHLNCDRAFT_55206 [Chlorella variabilis]
MPCHAPFVGTAQPQACCDRPRQRPARGAAAARRPQRLPVAAAAPGGENGNGAPATTAALHANGSGPPLETTTVGKSTNIRWQESMVSRDDKERLLGQRGCVLWFTGGCPVAAACVTASVLLLRSQFMRPVAPASLSVGGGKASQAGATAGYLTAYAEPPHHCIPGLSGSGKSTVSCTLEHMLHELGHFTSLLDGDNVRHGLNKDLGFSAEDRTENIRRIGEVAILFKETGTPDAAHLEPATCRRQLLLSGSHYLPPSTCCRAVTMTSFISPYRADRDMVRQRCRPGEFLEVFMNIPLEVCEQRDPKGLYKKARAGLIKNFTGIDDPYEAPLEPEIVVDCFDADGQQRTPRDMAEQILKTLQEQGYLRDPTMPTLAVANALLRKHSDGILDFAQL